MEFDTRARLHHNKKKQKHHQQQQSHSGLHSVATYHDHPPVREQPNNDDHSVTTTAPAGYVPYRDQDEMTDSSSSEDDSDSDSNIPTNVHTPHGDATGHSQGQSQFGTLLNLDSPPASTATANVHDGGWVSTSSTGDDLAAVFGNTSVGIKTANLLDITVGEQSDTNSQSRLAPPLQTNASASSSIEDLLFGGDGTSSSSLQQPPTSAGNTNLFGNSNVLFQPQATTYSEPTVIGNLGAHMGTNYPSGVATQVYSGSQLANNRPPQKSSSSASLTKDDPFAQFVTLQTGSIPSSQSSTPGSSPWPGTSPHPGGSPRSSPIPPGVNVSGANPPRYGMNTGPVMGSQYSQGLKNKSYSSSATTQPAVGGGAKMPATKKPQSTNYTSVIGGREERGVRRSVNPTGM